MADRRDSKNRKLNKGEYQRSDGRYAYRYIDTDGTERWIYSWKLTATDIPAKGKNSEKCLRDLEFNISKARLEGINFRTSNVITLNDMFHKYIEIKTGMKESTLLNYKSLWKRVVEQSIGREDIARLRYSDVAKFFSSLADERGLGASSINNVYTLVHPVFELAVRDDLIKKNPSTGVKNDILRSRSLRIKKKHALTLDQQEAFLKYLRDTPKYRRWFRLFIFLLGTGCRIGEARGLTWDDCDFERGIIYIRRQLSYFRSEGSDKCTNHVMSTKTETGERTIPMFTAVREVLIEEWKIQSQRNFETEIVDGVSGFIFVTKHGTCLDVAAIDGAINRITGNYNAMEEALAEKENREPIFLPRFSSHNLRHTFCTRMCENESNLKVVQEIMGHSDISTTLNVYADATADEKAVNFERLDEKIVRI